MTIIKITKYLLVYNFFIITERKILNLQFENLTLLSIYKGGFFVDNGWLKLFHKLTTDIIAKLRGQIKNAVHSARQNLEQ